ncbi:hypothetical protein, partial [Caldibacillus thermoamylovorans]|uniref:hypothetical protein n=1 Tax=Caldibacillus thermoamylovorans TaxID=35841 RepID=UPI00203E9573
PRYHKKIPPNANILGFLHTLIITYLAKFGWNYLEEFLLFRAVQKGFMENFYKTRLRKMGFLWRKLKRLAPKNRNFKLCL